MKRFLAAVSLSLIALPGFAAETGKPFEDLDLARALPNVPERAAHVSASSGQTHSQNNASARFTWATGPWANDYHFIAPPK